MSCAPQWGALDSALELVPELGGALIVNASYSDIDRDYSILLGSIDFIHNDRSGHHAFTYDLGFSTNAHGDKATMRRAVLDSYAPVRAGEQVNENTLRDILAEAATEVETMPR